jgi:ABC-type arginine transport system permease subunit
VTTTFRGGVTTARVNLHLCSSSVAVVVAVIICCLQHPALNSSTKRNPDYTVSIWTNLVRALGVPELHLFQQLNNTNTSTIS